MSNEIENLLRKKWGALYAKATTNTGLGIIESRKRFKKKYPYAKLNKFEFDVDLNPTTADVSKYIVRYKVPDSDGSGEYSSYDITSDTFTKNPEYRKDLFWKEFWEDSGTVQDFEKNTQGISNRHFHPSSGHFGNRIYVSNNKNFSVWLPPLEITPPRDGANVNDYKENPYLASLYAAYISTYLCGVSTYHFEEHNDVSKMVTSLMKYHLYFHMARFLKNPSLMDQYIDKDITKIITTNTPKKYIIEKGKFESTKESPELWKATRPNSIKWRIRNVKAARNASGNYVGVNYEYISGTQIHNLKNDWKLFVATKTNGFTDTGVKLLQETIESFVYSILGAQAKTTWPIAGGDKGKTAQTAEVFKQIVQDTIIQTDPTVAIQNMKTAIIDTRVRLNLAICPGVILMPSKLIILDKTIQGYNNILTVAHKNLFFGKNNQVNTERIAKSKNAVDTTPKTPTVRTTPQVNQVSQPKLQEKKSETELVTKTTTTTAVATTGPRQVAKYIPQHDNQILYAGISMATIGVLVAMFVI